MNNSVYSSILPSLLLTLIVGQSTIAAENCSSYLNLVKEYQKDRKGLLACGIPENDYFMKANHDEQADWCAKATQTEVDQRKDQAGLPTLHCRGILHYFSITSDVKSSQRLGLINAQYETVKLEPVPPDVLKAIIANSGKKTGVNFSTLPIQDLQGSSPACRLLGVKTNLSTDPTQSHWLVSAEVPCQRDEFNQSPFWLVEQQSDHYQILLAYRSSSLLVQNTSYQGYFRLETNHIIDNGEYDDADILWQYDPVQGQYRYLASSCSNLGRMDDTESAFIKDCYKDETW